MNLKPCSGCGRHVRVDAPVCPFCERAQALTAPTAHVLGRVSRAAVFASALGGCWTSSPPPAETPHPRPPDTSSASPTNEPTNEPTFAKPPDGVSEQRASTGPSIEGSVTDAASGGPITNAEVELRRGSSQFDPVPAKDIQHTRTDENGSYQFTNIAPGTYTLVIRAGLQARTGYPFRLLTIEKSTGLLHLHIAVQASYPSHPIAAPYGAPPARRRVV